MLNGTRLGVSWPNAPIEIDVSLGLSFARACVLDWPYDRGGERINSRRHERLTLGVPEINEELLFRLQP